MTTVVFGKETRFAAAQPCIRSSGYGKKMKRASKSKSKAPGSKASAAAAGAGAPGGGDGKATEVQVVANEKAKPKFVVFPVAALKVATEEEEVATPVVVVEDAEEEKEQFVAPIGEPGDVPVPDIILPATNAPAPPPEPTPIPEDAVCFPAFATVELESGSIKRMDELSIGDRVRTGSDSFSDVFMFTHKLAHVVNDFVRIQTAAGQELTLTHSHYLYLNGALAAADQVRIGDSVQLSSGSSTTVTAVTYTKETGLYNPQTLQGDIFVDGVRASTYTRAVPPKIAHTLLAPLRTLYRAGAGDASRGIFEGTAGPDTSML